VYRSDTLIMQAVWLSFVKNGDLESSSELHNLIFRLKEAQKVRLIEILSGTYKKRGFIKFTWVGKKLQIETAHRREARSSAQFVLILLHGAATTAAE
jgi:hypothetical protein